MRRFPLSRFILCALLACLTIPISSAASSVDAKLLSLVPPGAQCSVGSRYQTQFRRDDAESGIDLNFSGASKLRP